MTSLPGEVTGVNEILWSPSPERAAATNLARFQEAAPGSPRSYEGLWRWSVEELSAFWAQVWDECGVVASRPYERVMGPPRMPGTDWFRGARLNLAENCLRRRDDRPALIGAGEGREVETLSFADLRTHVARAQRGLADLGVEPGDRVAGFLPNCVEAVVMMLATASLGAVWSSCSPDFGPLGVVDRFSQVSPRVLVAANGYRYGGRTHAVADTLGTVREAVGSVEHVVTVDFVEDAELAIHRGQVPYDQLLANDAAEPTFAQLPFDHPLFVMYSSGTTGAPKSIVHGAGGTLVKHLCEHQLHTDVQPGDVVFWYTTTGWMMWNWLATVLASGATMVCYDGSPVHPDVGALWRLAERLGITHFGTSPRYLAVNERAGAVPRQLADLTALRSLLSTGAPLLPEQFDWVYGHVKPELHLASVSGGTDIIGCFAAGVPTEPVRRGELQARALGMAVEAWDTRGEPVVGEKGELVCTKPFPSMPTGFWNDPDGSRYHEAYFAEHPGSWTHGDFIEIRPEGGVIIHGRSDTTLNPGGVRIGTAEIYRALEALPEIVDAVVVDRPSDGDTEIVLCVVLAESVELDEALADTIRAAIRESTSPRHVPAHVFAVSEVPYTLNGKKVETAVRAALAGERVVNRHAIANPHALDEYAALFPASA